MGNRATAFGGGMVKGSESKLLGGVEEIINLKYHLFNLFSYFSYEKLLSSFCFSRENILTDQNENYSFFFSGFWAYLHIKAST